MTLIAESRDHVPISSSFNSRPLVGRVMRAVGTTVEAVFGEARIGELCELRDPETQLVTLAEVIGINDNRALLAPLGDLSGLSTRTEVSSLGRRLRIPVGPYLLGRVLDGFGNPLDQRPLRSPAAAARYPVDGAAPSALQRRLIDRPMAIGLRAIDGLLTCGEGQRIGIYGEPGTGKSSLLAQIISGTEADITVAALIGERGREVAEFLNQRPSGHPERSITVVATADRPAIERVKAAQLATTIAEYFRDQGRRVLLVIDSITRFARAQREIGLAAGEPPTRRGFTPSVFTALPRLLERSGANEHGSITAFYTVLVEGDGMMDPIAEETRAILDGHIVLSGRLAQSDHFPAIDVLQSRSRVMRNVTDPQHQASATYIRDLMARHAEIDLLLRTGDYQPGGDARTDEAVAKHAEITAFLRQRPDDVSPWQSTLQRLRELTR